MASKQSFLAPERARGETLFVYLGGAVFVVLLMVFYIKADIILGWMEDVVRRLFL